MSKQAFLTKHQNTACKQNNSIKLTGQSLKLKNSEQNTGTHEATMIKQRIYVSGLLSFRA